MIATDHVWNLALIAVDENATYLRFIPRSDSGYDHWFSF